MNKKIMFLILIIIIVLVLVTGYFYFTKSQMSKNEMRFTGKITAVDFEGSRDGDDFITVNGIEIKLAGGKSEHEDVWGQIKGINFGGQEKDYIGKTVNVYAAKYISIVDPKTNTFTDTYEDGRVTIKGNKKYFVEVVQ